MAYLQLGLPGPRALSPPSVFKGSRLELEPAPILLRQMAVMTVQDCRKKIRTVPQKQTDVQVKRVLAFLVHKYFVKAALKCTCTSYKSVFSCQAIDLLSDIPHILPGNIFQSQTSETFFTVRTMLSAAFFTIVIPSDLNTFFDWWRITSHVSWVKTH